ncbi:unnamed protein product, partial [Ixodes pacificus]
MGPLSELAERGVHREVCAGASGAPASSGSIERLTFALPPGVVGRLGSAQRQVDTAPEALGGPGRRRFAPRTHRGAVARGVALDGSSGDEHPARMLRSVGRKKGARAAAAEHAHTPPRRILAKRRAAR